VCCIYLEDALVRFDVPQGRGVAALRARIETERRLPVRRTMTLWIPTVAAWLVVFGVGAGLTGCTSDSSASGDGGDGSSSSADDGGDIMSDLSRETDAALEQTGDALRTAGEAIRRKASEFGSSLEEDVSALDERFEAWRANVAEETAPARKAAIEEYEEQKRALAKKLDELSVESAEAWKTTKAELQEAYADLERKVDQLMAEDDSDVGSATDAAGSEADSSASDASSPSKPESSDS